MRISYMNGSGVTIVDDVDSDDFLDIVTKDGIKYRIIETKDGMKIFKLSGLRISVEKITGECVVLYNDSHFHGD